MTQEKEGYMRMLWHAWFAEMQAQGCADAFYDELVLTHGKTERFYHTWYGHIYDLMRECDSLECDHTSDVWQELTLTIVTHDAIMDFTQSDNELQSADYARDLAHRMHLSDDFAQRVHMHVMATAGHNATDPVTQLFCDIDLSILGKPWPIVSTYNAHIKSEYGFVSEKVYIDERVRILTLILNKDRIFTTTRLHEKYEEDARANLTRIIKDLQIPSRE